MRSLAVEVSVVEHNPELQLDPELRLFASDLGIASAFDRDLQIALLEQHDATLQEPEPFDPADPKGKKAAANQRVTIVPPGCTAGGSSALPPSRVLGAPPALVPTSRSSPATWDAPLGRISGLTPAVAPVNVEQPPAPFVDNILELIDQNQEAELQRMAPTSVRKRLLSRYLASLAKKEEASA